jgi:hypothetical protein
MFPGHVWRTFGYRYDILFLMQNLCMVLLIRIISLKCSVLYIHYDSGRNGTDTIGTLLRILACVLAPWQKTSFVTGVYLYCFILDKTRRTGQEPRYQPSWSPTCSGMDLPFSFFIPFFWCENTTYIWQRTLAGPRFASRPSDEDNYRLSV